MAAQSMLLVMALPVFVLACAGRGTHAASAPDDDGVVRGTVSYRERMALPPDAIVEVSLSDISLQDVAATVIATTTVRPEGRQVPLPFELRYDPSRIQPNHTYAVRATVRSAGQLVYTTDIVHREITQGRPRQVDLVLKRVGGVPDRVSTSLSGTAWRLEDLAGAGVLDRSEATLEFPEAGKVAGSGSCNRFFGTVEISADSIRFGSLGATRMACPEAVMTQEGKYLKALQDAERFTLEGAVLLIYCKELDKPLRFVRKES